MSKQKERHLLFLEIWDEEKKWDEEKEDYYVKSFETGKVLWEKQYRENSSCFSHILSKKKYPQYDLLKSNIKIVHPDEHVAYETDQDKTPKQKEEKIKLLELHKKGLLLL